MFIDTLRNEKKDLGHAFFLKKTGQLLHFAHRSWLSSCYEESGYGLLSRMSYSMGHSMAEEISRMENFITSIAHK